MREKIRTPGLLIRSQTLYPAELRAHFSCSGLHVPHNKNLFYLLFLELSTLFFKNLNLTIKNVRISQKNAESTGISQTAFFPERRLYYGNETSAKAQRLCDVFAGSRHRCARQHPYDDNCHSDLSRDPVHHVWAVVPREHLHVQSRPRRCHRRLQCTPHQYCCRWVFFFYCLFPTPMQNKQYWQWSMTPTSK